MVPLDTKTALRSAASAICMSLEVNAMSVKLPEFYALDLLARFQCAEAHFGLRSVTLDEIKFWLVLVPLMLRLLHSPLLHAMV